MKVEKVELQIKIPKDVYELLKEFSNRFVNGTAEDYISQNVIVDLYADLDCLTGIEKLSEAEELWQKAHQLKEKYSKTKRISFYLF